jgi:hypothetical protein
MIWGLKPTVRASPTHDLDKASSIASRSPTSTT